MNLLKKIVFSNYPYKLALIAGLLVQVNPANANEKSTNQNQVFCEERKTISINEYPKLDIPEGFSDIDTHVLDKDFRHPKPKIPWSDTKVFDDPVIGSYPGVMDRNYIPGASRIHTLWYKDVILAEGFSVYMYSAIKYEFNVLMIPNGNSYIVIHGCNGRFPVDEKVAEVLRNQSPEKKMFIKLFAEGSGVGQLNEIGSGTVKAWKKIYANWSRSPESRPEQLGY